MAYQPHLVWQISSQLLIFLVERRPVMCKPRAAQGADENTAFTTEAFEHPDELTKASITFRTGEKSWDVPWYLVRSPSLPEGEWVTAG